MKIRLKRIKEVKKKCSFYVKFLIVINIFIGRSMDEEVKAQIYMYIYSKIDNRYFRILIRIMQIS